MNAHAHRAGLVFAALLGGFHAGWALLVFLGVAQGLMDFVFWAHMIYVPYIVGPFEVKAALTLVALTGAIGYIMGVATQFVWSKVHRAEQE